MWARLKLWFGRPGTKKDYLFVFVVVGGILIIYAFLRFTMNPCGDHYTCF
ncbi:MAG TPA: hypothetical protein VID24_12980 [Candidatus Eremiobacteraceae bacterium]|jgi:hypothetical protein